MICSDTSIYMLTLMFCSDTSLYIETYNILIHFAISRHIFSWSDTSCYVRIYSDTLHYVPTHFTMSCSGCDTSCHFLMTHFVPFVLAYWHILIAFVMFCHILSRSDTFWCILSCPDRFCNVLTHIVMFRHTIGLTYFAKSCHIFL